MNKSQEENTSNNQIEDLNMEILFFLRKFSNFRQKQNVMDKSLFENLQKVLFEIDSFLDSNPTAVPTAGRADFNIDTECNSLRKVFFCEICQRIVNYRGKDIRKHLKTESHRTVMEKSVLQTTVDGLGPKKSNNKKQQKEDKKDQQQKENKKEPQQKENKKEQQQKERKVPVKKEHAGKVSLTKKALDYVRGNYLPLIMESVAIGNKLIVIPEYNQLRTSLQKLLPAAKICFFGSRFNGLGSKNSDVDIFINIGDVYHQYQYNKESIQRVLNKIDEIANLLTKHPEEWKVDCKIVSARVPILRAYNIILRIDCDMSFSNGLADCNTNFIRHINKIFPLCQKMCFFVKNWMKKTKLHMMQFSTYTFVLMVIFYLQHKKYFPPLKLFQQIDDPLMIGPWQGNFAPKQMKDFDLVEIDDTAKNLDQEIQSFFKFYANFNYDQFVISPYLGEPIKKTDFNTGLLDMPRYNDYYKLDPTNNGFQLDKAMCVQDFLEQNHNVSKGVSQRILIQMTQFCEYTIVAMSADRNVNTKPSTSTLSNNNVTNKEKAPVTSDKTI